LKKPEKKSLTLITGALFIALGLAVAVGALGSTWLGSAAARRWTSAEVHGLYLPQHLDPGTEIESALFTIYNGADSYGSMVFNVHIPGYPAWQFEKSCEPGEELNVTGHFYRQIPVMPNASLTVTAEDLFGNTRVTATIQPAAQGTETLPEAQETESGEGSEEEEAEPYSELALITLLRSYFPAVSTHTLVIGGALVFAGVGICFYGISEEPDRR